MSLVPVCRFGITTRMCPTCDDKSSPDPNLSGKICLISLPSDSEPLDADTCSGIVIGAVLMSVSGVRITVRQGIMLPSGHRGLIVRVLGAVDQIPPCRSARAKQHGEGQCACQNYSSHNHPPVFESYANTTISRSKHARQWRATNASCSTASDLQYVIARTLPSPARVGDKDSRRLPLRVTTDSHHFSALLSATAWEGLTPALPQTLPAHVHRTLCTDRAGTHLLC